MKLHSSLRNTVAIGLIALAMFAGTARPAHAFLDKTRFAAHLGIAYYCFHHWVLKPYGEQKFAAGAPHRTSTIIKGGIALLFAVHEAKVAAKIAQTSKDPLLQKLSGNVSGLVGSFGTVGQRFKSGKFSPDDVKSLDSQTTAVGSAAAAGGAPIKDVAVPVPGT